MVYAPTLSVAGERNRVPVHELKNMLTGALPAAESQLIIDRSFVLRHLGKGFGAEVPRHSCRSREDEGRYRSNRRERARHGSAPPPAAAPAR